MAFWLAPALSLCVLLASAFFASASEQEFEPAVWPAPRAVDAERLRGLGLRVVKGEFVTLVTDLPATGPPGVAEVDRLPAVAAEALPQLAAYFGLPPAKLDGWRALACVIDDKERFAAAGLMPPPEDARFPHGLSRGYEFWVNEQASDYYRRALFLHELTHCFMATRLGSCGPGWYMEATAELMGAHRFDPPAQEGQAGALRLGVMPASREAAPLWGRVPLVRAARSPDGRPAPLAVDAVMRIDNRRLLDTTSYAWVWSLAQFLDGHPRYRDRWRKLPRLVLRRDFNARFKKAFRHDWREMTTEYQLFAATLAYGHDLRREAIDFRKGEPLGAEYRMVEVRADRGWQSTGLAVEAGRAYSYRTKGRFAIARDPDGTPWPCGAGGVTIDYHAGRPLGQLLAAVDSPGGLLQPLALSPRGEVTAPATGTLYLRVNDSPARLADNEGKLRVALKRSE